MLPYRSFWYNRDRRIIPDLLDYVPVPCGHCINCLRNKQNALVSRCLEESDKRGTFSFVTLTYKDENLPISQSLWRASVDTGEIQLVSPGEIVSSCEDNLFLDRAKVLSLAAGPEPRYFDRYIDGFSDGEFVYFSRLTPSLNVRDVRLWLKRCRVSFERETGKHLDFSYVIVGEMGPRTCRPHYHLAFFGLQPDEVRYFADRWTYGYTDVKNVKSVNPDGTDGFAIASRYIGKYMSKGKFDCSSVKDKSALKPRVCQSKGIGKSLIVKLRSSMCCFDMFGAYDINTFFCPSLGRGLTEDEISQIVKEIPNRLKYDSSYGFNLPIPRLFRDAVFCSFETKKVVKRTINPESNNGRLYKTTYKKKRIPSALWLMVSSFIRDNFSSNANREFKKYLSRFVEREIPSACYQFDAYKEGDLLRQEFAREANYIDFLNHSKDCQ